MNEILYRAGVKNTQYKYTCYKFDEIIHLDSDNVIRASCCKVGPHV